MRRHSLHPAAPLQGGGVKSIAGFLLDDSGQAATEYVLIVGLVCILIVVAFNKIQDSLKGLLTRVVAGLNGPGI